MAYHIDPHWQVAGQYGRLTTDVLPVPEPAAPSLLDHKEVALGLNYWWMSKAGVTVLLLLGLVLVPVLGAESPPAYKVVVNWANTVSTLSRDSVSRIFLKKTTTWPDGKTTAPVDQATETPTVRNNVNAIGYVGGDAKLGEGVKVLTVQ